MIMICKPANFYDGSGLSTNLFYMVDNPEPLCYNMEEIKTRWLMKTKDIILIAMFAALITVGAFIRIPVPVCPFTLQFLFTTLAGVILGGRKGAIAVSVYVLLGLAGLPVFTGGGGISYVFQPTFGYLLGFIGGAYMTGRTVHNGSLTMSRLLSGCFAGLFIVYTLGMTYYWAISRFYLGEPVGIWQLFLYCFILAVPGDICLCILSAVLGKRLIPAIDLSYKNA